MDAITLSSRSWLPAGMLLALVGIWLTGCGVSASVRAGDGGGGGSSDGNGDGGGSPAGEDEVRIRFVNSSDLDVDTQFYAANDALADPGEDLFQPKYRIQESIGVAGTGIIQAGTEDEITFPCTEDTVLGTEGGEFLDPDRGTLLATGQRRILRVDLGNFDCGNTVIFGFTEQGGDYDSVPPIPDSRD